MTDHVISSDRVGAGVQFEFPVGGDGDTLTVAAAATVHSTNSWAVFGTGNDQSVTIAGAVSSSGLTTIGLGANSVGAGLARNSVFVEDDGLLRNGNVNGLAIRMESYASTIGNAGYILAAGSGIDFSGENFRATSIFENSGTLDAGFRAIVHSGVENVRVVNTGLIEGLTAYIDTRGALDVIENSGRMVGDIFFGSGADAYDGAEGSFRGAVHGGSQNDKITMGDDNDSVFGDGDNDTLSGGGGNDELFGGAGADTIGGGIGNDTLYGGAGGDYLSGGTGTDTASYFLTPPPADGTTGVYASLVNPTINAGEAAGDRYNSVERLDGSNYNDRLFGTDGANVIRGFEGADSIKGYAGADNLVGGDGQDTLEGGAGGDRLTGNDGGLEIENDRDMASYAGAASRVVASLANASVNTGDAAGDVYFSIEELRGSAFDDVLNGNNFDNRIEGGAGDDTIKGYNGNDGLVGGAGRDVFVFNSTPNAMTNFDSISTYIRADDEIWLDRTIFSAVGPVGQLAASAFRVGAQAGDASDRIIFDPGTNILYYDPDGTGAGAAAPFALMQVDTMTAAEFRIV